MESKIKQMMELYSFAKQDEIEYTGDVPEYTLRYVDIIDQKGHRKFYEAKGNGECIESDDKESIVKYLNSIGYFYDSSSYYLNDTYINTQKFAEYKKKRDEVQAHNKSLKEARIELSNLFKQYLTETFDSCYVRFGEIPEYGRSYNFRDGFFEEGVSAFKAYKVGALYIIDVAGGVFTYFGYKNRKILYCVDGQELVGYTGSDGEPVLRDCKIISVIDNDKFIDVKNYMVDFFENLEVQNNNLDILHETTFEARSRVADE